MLDSMPTQVVVPAPSDDWKLLRAYAEMFHDAQQSRIAFENRLLTLPIIRDDFANEMRALHHRSELLTAKLLRNTFKRAHPALYEWTQATRGVGEHTVARLLGLTGHPRYAYPKHWEGAGESRVLVEGEPHPRGIRQFYAYCGVGDPTRRRRKGMVDGEQFAAGNPRAKPLIFLLATSQVKSSGVYRELYDTAKKEYQDRGEWTPGHCHNAALRRVGKQLLRDIWMVA